MELFTHNNRFVYISEVLKQPKSPMSDSNKFILYVKRLFMPEK